MAEKRRKYTKEFKEEAVRLLKGGDRSLAQIARDIGVSDTTLWGWAYRRGKNADKAPAQSLTEAEEVRQLRRENALLREEREILKKRWPSSPRRASEVCFHRGGEGQSPGGCAVSGSDGAPTRGSEAGSSRPRAAFLGGPVHGGSREGKARARAAGLPRGAERRRPGARRRRREDGSELGGSRDGDELRRPQQGRSHVQALEHQRSGERAPLTSSGSPQEVLAPKAKPTTDTQHGHSASVHRLSKRRGRHIEQAGSSADVEELIRATGLQPLQFSAEAVDLLPQFQDRRR